jgi:hypothetical protein
MAFSRASNAATAPGSARFALASMPRSSISAASTSIGMPAPCSSARRLALFDASTSGLSASQSDMI